MMFQACVVKQPDRRPTYETMGQGGVLVVVGEVESKEVHINRMFLPHRMKHHHDRDALVDGHSNLGVFHNGNLHPKTYTYTICVVTHLVLDLLVCVWVSWSTCPV